MTANIKTILDASVQEFLEDKLVIFQDDVKYNQISSAVGQYLERLDVIKNAIKGHMGRQAKSAQEQNEVSKEVKTLLRNMVRTETNKHWKTKFGASTSVTEYMITNIKTILDASVQEFLEDKLVIFQDDVKYNQISSAVGQYLERSDVIKNAIKGHLGSQDKSAQEQNKVSKEVKTLLWNMVRTEANK